MWPAPGHPDLRRHYISRQVRDHTAILKFIERKWNIGALTFRDANADDLFDCLDFAHAPAFLDPPALPAPALAGSNPPVCTPGDPGTIPPPDAVTRVSPGSHAKQRSLSRRRAANPRMGEPLAEVWSQVRPGAPDPAR